MDSQCQFLFYGDGVVSPTSQCPTWGTGVPLCHLSQKMCSMGGPTSRWAPAVIDFLIADAHKPCHVVKNMPSRRWRTIEGCILYHGS